MILGLSDLAVDDMLIQDQAPEASPEPDLTDKKRI
jgi:hypothetical protein